MGLFLNPVHTITDKVAPRDIMLPDGSGLDVLQFFKKRFPEVICFRKSFGGDNLVRIAVVVDSDAVEDTGIGIAEENMGKVFSRFFTVDKSHGGKNGGFGLGLAVVKKICKKSGWTIDVESKLGEGSKFTVEF